MEPRPISSSNTYPPSAWSAMSFILPTLAIAYRFDFQIFSTIINVSGVQIYHVYFVTAQDSSPPSVVRKRCFLAGGAAAGCTTRKQTDASRLWRRVIL